MSDKIEEIVSADKIKEPGDETRDAYTKLKNQVIKKTVLWIIIELVVATIAILGGFYINNHTFQVSGTSMYPTFKNGEALWGTRSVGNLKHNDIVIDHRQADSAHNTNYNVVKRVIGTPGDAIKITSSNIYLNGKKISNHHTDKKLFAQYGSQYQLAFYQTKYLHNVGKKNAYYKVNLGKNQYYLMGDNRLASRDSRFYGPVNKSSIKAKIEGRFNKTPLLVLRFAVYFIATMCVFTALYNVADIFKQKKHFDTLIKSVK